MLPRCFLFLPVLSALPMAMLRASASPEEEPGGLLKGSSRRDGTVAQCALAVKYVKQISCFCCKYQINSALAGVYFTVAMTLF